MWIAAHLHPSEMSHPDEYQAQRLAAAAARILGLDEAQRDAYKQAVLEAIRRGDPLHHRAGLEGARRAGFRERV